MGAGRGSSTAFEPLTRPVRWLIGSTRLLALLLMLGSTGLVIGAYRPGLMGNDTLSMLDSVRSGVYTDWHSPLLAATWRLGYRHGIGPGWVLAATVLLLVASVYFLVRPWLPRLAAATVAAAVPLLPQVLGYLGILMRDPWYMVLLVASFGFAVRGLRRGISDGRRVVLAALSTTASWFAIASRQNGLPSSAIALVAAVMVVWPLVTRRLPDRLRSPAWKLMIGAVLWVVLLLLIIGSQRVLLSELDVQRLHPEQATMINDLAAMSLRRGEVLFDPEVFPAQDLATLRRQSSNYNIDNLVFGPDASIRVPLSDRAFRKLRNDWIDAVEHHPLDYLAERWTLWSRQISISGNAWGAVNPGLRPNPYGYPIANPGLNRFAFDYLRHFTTSVVDGGPVHRVWVYLLITVGAIVWFLRHRSTLGWAMALMGLSSLAYTASMFFGATSLQYRFSLPCVLIGIVLLVDVIADSIRRSMARARARASMTDPAALQPSEELVGSAQPALARTEHPVGATRLLSPHGQDQ